MTDLHPLLSDRWSTRAFDATHELAKEDLDALLEAARWAPSASNSQPWRFAVARRGTAEHDALAATLVGFNREWAMSASALLVAVAVTVNGDGKPLAWAAYDTGQAVAHLSVQAQSLGLAVHQMGGFDAAAMGALLGLDDTAVAQVVVAVGRHDPAAVLPDALAARETAPRTRTDLEDLLLSVRLPAQS